MANRPSVDRLLEALPTLSVEDVADAIHRLPDRYFEFFDVAVQHRHIEFLTQLSSESPVHVMCEWTGHDRVECTVITYNYPFLFSLITGLLSSSEFEIVEGEIFTYSKQQTPIQGRVDRRKIHTHIRRRKVVDYFSGRLPRTMGFRKWASEITDALRTVIMRLEVGDDAAIRDAGEQVIRRAANSIHESSRSVANQMSPIQIEVENSTVDVTCLTLIAENTPFFLFSFGTALAHHGISIERLSITTIGNQVRDQFFLCDANGQRLESDTALDQLRLSVVLCKQFTFFLDQAPNPFDAISRFEQFVTAILSRPEKAEWLRLLSNPLAMQDMARLLGTSDYIWEDFIRLHYESLLPILGPTAHDQPIYTGEATIRERLLNSLAAATDYDDVKFRINQFKDQEIYLMDLGHILGQSDIVVLSKQLTRLVEIVVNVACQIVFDRLVELHGVPMALGKLPASYSIFGLGKLGGEALGYASDIELMLMYSDNGVTDHSNPMSNSDFFSKMVNEVTYLITAKRKGIFDIDLRLRPYGNDGPLGVSVENFCRYFGANGPSHLYERVALVRLRWIGGDLKLGRRVETLRDAFVYESPPADFSELWELRRKQYQEKASHRLNAKFSPGALVDIEYTVQALQIMAGHDHVDLRSPHIRETLNALGKVGILSDSEAERMTEAYIFLRQLINGLRMLRGSAEDLFLPDESSTEYDHLARRMGYNRKDSVSAASQLHMDFEATTATVRHFVERHFSTYSLPSVSVATVADLVVNPHISDELRCRIVSKYGFRDVQRAIVNLVRLQSYDRDGNHFPRLIVLACDWLRHKSDPDMALNNWERFVAQLDDPVTHFAELLSQPLRLDILLDIFSVSQFLSDSLIRHPEFFDDTTETDRLHSQVGRGDLLDELTIVSSRCTSNDMWRNELRRFKTREILRIAIKDISLQISMPEIYREISIVAESIAYQCLVRALNLDPDVAAMEDRVCIFAMGKLGASELNYSSDIDLIPIVDWTGLFPEDISRLAPKLDAAIRRFSDDLSVFTEEGHAYRVDYSLRPFGRAGQLMTAVTSLLEYYRTSSSQWEIQALLKMRPLAGNWYLGFQLIDELHTIAPSRFSPDQIVSHIRYLRAAAIRKSSRRIGMGIDIKNGDRGIRDIEFWVQGLQLMHIRDYPSLWIRGTLNALDHLRHLGIVPAKLALTVRDIYLLFRRLEHFLQLLDDQQTHTLPTHEVALTALAKRLLGTTFTGTDLIDVIESYREIVGSLPGNSQ